MSAHGFRSVFMVASCAGAALGCYLVSLRVASERAAVEAVETRIVLAQRDIRLLQTEIGTRGRLAQLERWNVKVLSLSAPSADQFLGGGFELARLVQPKQKVDIEAPVVLAAAREDTQKPRLESAPQVAPEERDFSPKALMQTVSLKRELPPEPALVRQRPVAAGTQKALVKPSTKPSAVEPSAATTPKKSLPEPKTAMVAAAKKPVVQPQKKTASDPLAALPAKAKKVAALTKKESTKTP